MELDTLRERVSSICARLPFEFAQAQTPFSFELQPESALDQVFRVEAEDVGEVIGGFNYREERTDRLIVWVARKYAADPERTYQTLVTDAASIRAAIVRDGEVTSGEYHVPAEGGGMTLQRDPGQSFAVLRVQVPVNYETTV